MWLKIQSSTISFSDVNFAENGDLLGDLVLLLTSLLLTSKPIQTAPALCKNIKLLYKPHQWSEKCKDIH